MVDAAAADAVAGAAEQQQPPRDVRIVCTGDSLATRSLARQLSAAMEAGGVRCVSDVWSDELVPDDGATTAAATTFVVEDNASHHLPLAPSGAAFEGVKHLLITCRWLLWISIQEDCSAHSRAKGASHGPGLRHAPRKTRKRAYQQKRPQP